MRDKERKESGDKTKEERQCNRHRGHVGVAREKRVGATIVTWRMCSATNLGTRSAHVGFNSKAWQ